MDHSIQWIRSPKSLSHIGPYLKARLIRPLQDHSLEFELNTDRGPLRLTLPQNSSFESGRNEDYEDMCEMDVLNEPEVLSNLIKRYRRDDIFTSIGPTLIALNPYKHIDRLFSRMVLEKARERTLAGRTAEGPSHVYRLAGSAFESIRSKKGKQAIVISGESGAGKTESTKYCVQLLTALGPWKVQSIQHKILAVNPVLQAFGNSKTVRNQNSSRFGKFMNIYFEEGGHIVGATIQSYLLEKSRVVTISPNERTFHAFYALTASGKYQVRSPEQYQLLKQSHCFTSHHVVDAEYFLQINKSFAEIGLSEAQISKIWTTLASILEVGNIEFDQTRHVLNETEPCQLIGAKQLQRVAQNLACDVDTLEKILLFEKRRFLKEFTLLPFGKAGCKANKEALCKALYQSLFEYILKMVQLGLQPRQPICEGQVIGILDIFGFQNFAINSFEQFCINYSNERLLRLYNRYIFQKEMDILEQDGLGDQICGLSAPSNEPLINLVSGKLSLFSIINDMTLPQFKDQDIVRGFQKLSSPHLSFDQLKPQLFNLAHTPCSVSYSIGGFKTKNQDKFNDDILELVGRLWGERKDQVGKTILSKFTKQMDDLMNELESSQVHFMRCIKPNDIKRPDFPDDNCILTQVKYLGILQTIFIRKNTFPHRRTYSDFKSIYCIAFRCLYKEGPDQALVAQALEQVQAAKGEYMLGKLRIYLSEELQQRLNKQQNKWLKIRQQKARILQRALKSWLFRRSVARNLKLVQKRIRILRSIPGHLELIMLVGAMERIKQYAYQVGERIAQQKEEAKLNMLRQAKQIREQERNMHNQQQLQIPNHQQPLNQARNPSSISESFNGLRLPGFSESQNPKSRLHGLSILLNETDQVSNKPIDPRSAYAKPQTPSAALMGQNLVFNQDFLSRISSEESLDFSSSTLAFETELEVPLPIVQSNSLQKLRAILQERYSVQITCSEEDFFSPMSSHCNFKMTDLPPGALKEIIEFAVEDYFNGVLRRRTTFFGSVKTYSEILVCKKSVLNKSMTVLSSEADEKRCLSIFKLLLKIGQEQDIAKVLKLVQQFLEACQNISLQLKTEIMVQMVRQSNTSYELTAIRIYQLMVVFLHVFNPSTDSLKATLNLFYTKLNTNKLGNSERGYLTYLFSFAAKKLAKRAVVGYIPIEYQIMGLLCKRQISVPVYLSTGTSVLINIESFHTFQDLREKALRQLGISQRLQPDLFGFFQIVNFDNEELQESPIRETNLVWDMITYWELTKQKYSEGGINPPNFYLMLKLRFAVQVLQEDEELVELCYAQLYFQYNMGRIMLEHALIFLLAALLFKIKQSQKTVGEVIMGLFPLNFIKKYKRQQAIERIQVALQELNSTHLSKNQMKFKFIKICSVAELAMATEIPTDQEFKLFVKPKVILIVDDFGLESQKIKTISFKKLIRWQIDRESLTLQVLATQKDKQNQVYTIKTDCSSIFNEMLRALGALRGNGNKGEVPSFKKK